MGTLIEVQAEFPFVGGLPRDVAVNTFHFWIEDAGDVGTIAPDLLAAVVAFYCEGGAGDSVSHFMSRVINWGSSSVTAYVVSDWDTSSPTWTPGGALAMSGYDTGGGLDSLPLEVALCLSYWGTNRRAGVGDIGNAARRRGRIYVGPLDGNTVQDVAVGALPHPNTEFITQLLTAASALKDDVIGLGDTTWVIWSRAGHSLIDVAAGWVDNEWDTQRRRGVDATTRTPFA